VTVPTKHKTRAKKPAKEHEIVITRIFDAPREEVWKAWTDPNRVKRWWGPETFTSPSCAIDLRVGGRFLFCMRSPDGKDFWTTGVYREIVSFERIVCTNCFADKKGNVVPATHYGMEGDFALEMLMTVTFEEIRGKTKMTLRHRGHSGGELGRMAKLGWNGSFDKLAESLKSSSGEGGTARGRKDPTELTLPTDREIVLMRVLDAPRERVFRAYTDPKAIPEWWGPRGFRTTVDTMDVRPGGAWRFVQVASDGTEHAFHGVYREIRPPERLVDTFEYEGMAGHVLVETVTFDEVRGGKTKVTVTSRFDSEADRDGMLESGMEWGARQTMERLEEYLRRNGPQD
jgi:uncharacterized protein YndB with AHSA1/START domain